MKREKTKVKENYDGITLISLVVTIIVLLILAGVAINFTVGENGIFTRTQKAVIANENASVYEELQLVVAGYQIDKYETGNNEKILERLKNDGYIDEKNIVNVEKLMNRSMQTGNGSIENGDIYIIEERRITASSTISDTTTEMSYYLIYYDEDNTDINLGPIIRDDIQEEAKNYVELQYEFDEENKTCICTGPVNKDYFYMHKPPEDWIIDIPEKVNGYTVVGITFESKHTGWGDGIKEIHIPKTVTERVDFGNMNFIDLERFVVDDENPVLFDYENSLYTKDEHGGIYLVEFPKGNHIIMLKNGVVDMLDSCNYIDNYLYLIYEQGDVPMPNALKEKGVHDSSEYVIENNCLLSTDRKILYAVTMTANSYTVPEGVEVLESNAFLDSRGKTLSIELPNTIKEIANNAFYDITLEELTVPSSVTTIEEYAFSFVNCYNLTILSSINSLVNCTFSQSTIYNLNFEGKITNFNLNSLEYATINTIRLPSTIETIEAYTDNFKSDITEIIINKPEGTIKGEPWGLENVNVVWNG